MRHPHVLQLIMDSLRYWVLEMHVDGFRFDLASTLARQFHEVDRLSAFFDLVQQDPVISQVKLIAEPWDVGEGGYQVGNFPPLWTEWNGKYRDTVRDFWRGEAATLPEFASRLTGSADLYQEDGRRPLASINFVTAHDGFTLHDLVSYNDKHNEANGEGNADGESHNRSWNCGVEGPTDDLEVLALRERQKRNFLTTLFLSQGVPMLLHGDELGPHPGGQQQRLLPGQPDRLGRLGGRPAELGADRLRRQARAAAPGAPGVPPPPLLPGRPERGSESELGDIAWFTPGGEHMSESDWQVGYARSVAVFLNGDAIAEPDGRGQRVTDDSFLLLFNGHHEDMDFTVPREVYGERWEPVLDTAAPRRGRPPHGQGRRARDPGVAVDPGAPTGGLSAPVTGPAQATDRHLPAAAATGLRLRRRRRRAALPARPRRLARLPLPRAAGDARLDARLRRRRPRAAERGPRRRRRVPPALGRRRKQLGMGVVVDVVPNHMAVPTPASLNAALWSVLRDRPASPYARWFDVDWAAQERAMLMPVLGRRIGEVVADGEITLDRDGDEPLLRYFDHVFPVRPGTEDLPMDELLDRQFYRLAHWRVGDEELNYRRFFDIDTLAGVRVEDEQVFAETHAVLLALVAEGRVHGLRIDHPDGLADPRGYLQRLLRGHRRPGSSSRRSSRARSSCRRTGRAPAPPATTRCCGSAACSSTRRVGAGPAPTSTPALTGEPADFAVVAEEAKRFVIEHGLQAEVARLVEVAATICHEHLALRDHTRRGLREALVELLVAVPVYRAYVVPDEPAPAAGAADPRSRRGRRPRAGLPRTGTAPWTWSSRWLSATTAAARTGTSSWCASSRPAAR